MVDNPANPPPPAPTPDFDTGAEIRRVLTDPDGPYAKRPDLAERMRQQLAAYEKLGAIPPAPPSDPLSVAREIYDHGWNLFEGEIPGIADGINERVELLEKLSAGERDERAAALSATLGKAAYEQLIKDAETQITEAGADAAKVRQLARCDAWLLRTLAAIGRHNRAYTEGRPKP